MPETSHHWRLGTQNARARESPRRRRPASRRLPVVLPKAGPGDGPRWVAESSGQARAHHRRVIAVVSWPEPRTGLGVRQTPGRLPSMPDRDPEDPSLPVPRAPDNPGLDDLGIQFDALLEMMQQPGVRDAVDRALRTTSQEMGRAAVQAARGAATPILMRHRIRLGVEIQTAADLAVHFRDLAGRVPDDPELAAALTSAAEGLERQQPPGQIASAL